jgi:hypothetical protein
MLGNSSITNFAPRMPLSVVYRRIKPPDWTPYFLNISHVHYGKIAKIETACIEYKTMRSAVVAHFKHLKRRNRNPEWSKHGSIHVYLIFWIKTKLIYNYSTII